MRYRFLITLFGVLACVGLARAQISPHPYRGTISAASSDCSTANSCVSVVMPDGTASATISVDASTGSLSGTLQFEQSVDGTVWIAAKPTGNSSTTASSTTSSGTWQINPSSYIHLRVRASARSSGSAAIVINWSTATASAGGPNGPTGPQGPTGATGATGPASSGAVYSKSTVVFSATPAFDASVHDFFKLILTGDVSSSTISNPTDGQTVIFLLCQDSAGSHSFAWPANVMGAGMIDPTLSTCNTQSFIYDSALTNWYALAPMVVGQ